jgi:branched-chain amino acid transport system substrate-binding protein
MKRLFVVLALVTVLALVAGCAPAPTPVPPTVAPKPTEAPKAPTAVPPTAAPKPAAAPIKFAIIGAMSGTNAILGEWAKKGITLAVEEKNKAGGIQGRQIELVIYDDEADPTKSVNLAQKVCTDDKVMAAFATTNSTSAIADIPIFQQYKIPQLTNGTSVDFTKKGSAYAFRVTPNSLGYEYTLINFLVKTKGFKKFAIIQDTSSYGKSESDAQVAALGENGLTALARESYSIDDKDFTGQLTKILQTQPEVLLLASSEVAAGLIAKQARQLGFKGQLAGPTAVGTPKFIETAGADIAEGSIFSTVFLPNPDDPINDKFVKAYRARWGEDPDFHGANTYDGMQLLFIAMEKANPLTPENVAAELHKIKGYKGIQGEFNVQENGETISQMAIGINKGGKNVAYK